VILLICASLQSAGRAHGSQLFILNEGYYAAVLKTSKVGTAGWCDLQGLSAVRLHRHRVIVTQLRLTTSTERKEEN
jgi:hypothetical protein